MDVKRGDIVYVEYTESVGSEYKKNRPVLVVSNDMGNKHATIVTVVPLSRTYKGLPTQCEVVAKGISYAKCESITTVSKERIGEYIRTASRDEMKEIERCIAVALGMTLNVENQSNVKTESDKPVIEALKRICKQIDSLYYDEDNNVVRYGINRARYVVISEYERNYRVNEEWEKTVLRVQ